MAERAQLAEGHRHHPNRAGPHQEDLSQSLGGDAGPKVSVVKKLLARLDKVCGPQGDRLRALVVYCEEAPGLPGLVQVRGWAQKPYLSVVRKLCWLLPA